MIIYIMRKCDKNPCRIRQIVLCIFFPITSSNNVIGGHVFLSSKVMKFKSQCNTFMQHLCNSLHHFKCSEQTNGLLDGRTDNSSELMAHKNKIYLRLISQIVYTIKERKQTILCEFLWGQQPNWQGVVLLASLKQPKSMETSATTCLYSHDKQTMNWEPGMGDCVVTQPASQSVSQQLWQGKYLTLAFMSSLGRK